MRFFSVFIFPNCDDIDESNRDDGLSCPKCGNKAFELASEFRSEDDLAGSICKECGYRLSEDDVVAHFSKVAHDLAMKVFGTR